MRGFGFDRITMEKEESLLGTDDGGGSNIPFLDRSKVKILLCDNSVKSSEEAFALLCKCSYQVTSVRTPRQVINALNAEGPDIDIILAEVDLPIAKGLKMLKYIMRDKELQRIPIIMMSAQDDVSVVVKCLRLGAADYLVKPLRTNELLNLWTHMWRRRRMLGLAEKNILNCDFDLVASDPSNANTNSTNLFSDDTDDKSWRSNAPEMSISKQWEDDLNVAASVEPPLRNVSEYCPNVPKPSEKMGKFSSFPKKSKLKIGESSAFLTYVRSSIPPSSHVGIGCVDENVASSEHAGREEKLLAWGKKADTDAQRHETREAWEFFHCDNGFPSSDNGFPSSDNDPNATHTKRSRTSSMPSEFPQERNSKEEQLSKVLLHPSKEAQVKVSGGPVLTPSPYYLSGMMNQAVMPSSAKMYQGNLQDLPKHATLTMLPQYNSLTHGPPHVPVMTSFPYYPSNICMQPGQMHATHMWSSIATLSSTEVKPGRVERREAALIKFRQKRKDRCFDKKIRYINRKRLAERRPRVRGQFVRQIDGVDVDHSGQPTAVEDSDQEVEEEDDD